MSDNPENRRHAPVVRAYLLGWRTGHAQSFTLCHLWDNVALWVALWLNEIAPYLVQDPSAPPRGRP